MELNGTFFVQAIHFLIVYAVLKKFLFRPIVDIIMQDRAYEQGLHSSIEQQNKIIERMQVEKHEQWQQNREVFAKQAPHIEPVFRKTCCQDVQVSSPAAPELDGKQVKELAQELRQRIDHVGK